MRVTDVRSLVIVSAICIASVTAAFAQGKVPKARITAAQADAAAVKRFHGKVVGKTKLENEDGKWQYSVMVKSGKTLREVMVGAKTGNIESVEVTTAAKERAEEKSGAASAKKGAKAGK